MVISKARRLAAVSAVLLLAGFISPAPAASARSGGGINVFFYAGSTDGSTVPARAKNCYQASSTTVDFDWGGGGPGGTCPSNNFYGYASGGLIAPFTGTVYFCSINDDGLNMKIGTTDVISSWAEQADEPNCNARGSFDMVQGTVYPIKIWYFENGGGAVLKLKWAAQYSDYGSDYEIIPWASLVPNK